MYDLKALKAKADDIIGKMEAAQAKIKEEEAKEKKDEKVIVGAKSLFDELKGEFATVKTELAEAKEHGERLALRAEIEEAAAAKGKIQELPEGTPAEAVDVFKEENEKTKLFLSYVQGKTLSDSATDAMSPKSKTLQEGEGAGSIVVPDRMLLGIMGKKWCRAMGKAIPFLSTGVTQGAPLVPEDFRADLQMLETETPTVFDRVSITPSGTGAVTWPALIQTQANTFGGVSFQWLGEGAEKPETEPQFEQLTIPTHELAGYTEVSERALSRSAIQLEAFISQLFRDAMRFTLDTVILTGNGTGQPTGIINTAGILTQARAAAGAVSDADLVRLKHQLLPVHRGNAAYAIHDEVEEALELAVDGFNRPLFRASTANGPFDRLVGFPYVVGTNLPGLGSTGDVIYGNFRHYMVAMEEEITMARSSEFRFRNNLIAFKIFSVVGGRLLEPLGMAILDANTS